MQSTAVITAKSEARAISQEPIRYAQCWEDADILLEALQIKPGDVVLSIASAGENTLAMLAHKPGRVVAIDRNPSQLACLELRAAAYRCLSYQEMLGFLGYRGMPSMARQTLYAKCRNLLSLKSRMYWDANFETVKRGVAHAGKFEQYFALFRKFVMPLVHTTGTVNLLLKPRNAEARRRFYDEQWNTGAWRLMFNIFFSRLVMGTFGRDRSCFKYVAGSVAERILERTRYALTELDPSENPYLCWILKGSFNDAVPFALREENFELIRSNLYRLELKEASIDEIVASTAHGKFDKFNLSDVFEYMPQEEFDALLKKITDCSNSGARLAYWNMLAPRHAGPQHHQVIRLENLSSTLHKQDKAFFYSAFVVEEIRK